VDQQQPSEPQPPRRVWRPSSVWKAIGIGAAIAAALTGLGSVAFIAWIAIAFSSHGSNK
jgi:Na+/H+ antiporter NhaD/arsenite permease-like protein